MIKQSVSDGVIRISLTQNIERNIMTAKLELEDVHYHNINEFNNDFDVKDIHEDLNICERCYTIVMWDSEMYWQGECEESYHYCMGSYEAVCDDCFNILSNNYQKGG